MRDSRKAGFSLFHKYFAICSVCVLSSILVLGMILLAFSSRFFERNKYDMMERFVTQAAAVTAENYLANDKAHVDKALISMAYSVVSKAIYSDVFLTDTKGVVVYHSGVSVRGIESAPLEDSRVARRIVDAAITNGIYEETGSMDGFFSSPQYAVGIPVWADDQPFGVVFAFSPADDLVEYMWEMFKMFCVSAIVVLALVSVVIYFITRRMVNPLKNMLDATHSFARGDFSKRVPVSSYDEAGQLSMAFNNMASTLAATESTRRSFVANVSHELKTPMTTISGFVDGILDGTIPEEKRDQYLEVVSNECKRLSRLVRSMLDTARLETGEMEINPTLFDVSEIIRQTIFTFEPNIEEKELEIRGLEQDRVMIHADKDLMYQVVYNLVDNAVKFVNDGGYIECSYQVNPGGTSVAIRNSGSGIAKEEASQLFERFYKSDRSRSANKDGVGLGLHIVRSIIHYHRGEITVNSVQGEFTEFVFIIPNPPTTK